jgi:hypothetical protein
MIDLGTTPTTHSIEVPAAAWLGNNPETDANIARYLAAGERMRVITGVGWKISIALPVLGGLAWALGLMFGAGRPF